MAVIYTSCKEYILWARDFKSMGFFNCYYIYFQDMPSSLVSLLSNKSLSYLLVESILKKFWMILCPSKWRRKILFSFLVQGIVIED